MRHQRSAAAGVSRQDFVTRAGIGAGGLLAAGALPAGWLRVDEAAAAANVIRIGFVSPRTGPLGGFGEPDGFALGLARKSLAKGLTIGGKHYAVQIIDKDTQSSPPRAGQLAKSLINGSKIDLMLSTSTPEVNNPIADACEAAGVPQ